MNIDAVIDRIASLLPGADGSLGADVRKNLRAVLTSALSRMDLVTREEFDVQTAVLTRTRERLRDLERQIAALEQALGAGAKDTREH